MDSSSASFGGGETAPLHLLRLVSQTLPIGGFSYSKGLEGATHAGWVTDEASAQDWILGILQSSFAQLDGALFLRLASALVDGDDQRFLAADAWLAASRESREFQLEDKRLGQALMRLLADLDVPGTENGQDRQLTFTAVFAMAAHHWCIPPMVALQGLMWIFVEGQVTAAIRLVPLGHTAGQRILVHAVGPIEQAAARAAAMGDDDIGNLAPALAMASAWHETQYSRLFQS
jgi:urease accessory protein